MTATIRTVALSDAKELRATFRAQRVDFSRPATFWARLLRPYFTKVVMRQSYVEEFSLYTAGGSRKYLNAAERQRAIAAMASLRPDQALFALMLAWTGARVSEVLALTPTSFQVDGGIVAFRTLKRRKHSVRVVPIPPTFMGTINRHFMEARALQDPQIARCRLWPWCRVGVASHKTRDDAISNRRVSSVSSRIAPWLRRGGIASGRATQSPSSDGSATCGSVRWRSTPPPADRKRWRLRSGFGMRITVATVQDVAGYASD
jgi:integrase